VTRDQKPRSDGNWKGGSKICDRSGRVCEEWQREFSENCDERPRRAGEEEGVCGGNKMRCYRQHSKSASGSSGNSHLASIDKDEMKFYHPSVMNWPDSAALRGETRNLPRCGYGNQGGPSNTGAQQECSAPTARIFAKREGESGAGPMLLCV